MPDSTEFDEFYQSTRTTLLWQTFALTGDLPAARSAVRDAYVAAWHHWRKVSRLEDPESWVRPRAWRYAQRRHSARIWHRDRSLDPELRATLDALAKLPLPQRKMLLLTQTASAPMPELAREVGLPLSEAERRLQTATSAFSLQRDVPTVSIPALLDALRVRVAEERWPRVTIIRRAGTARRRAHTAVGATAVIAAAAIAGAVVTDAQGVQPSLQGAVDSGVAASDLGRPPKPSATPTAAPTPVEETVVGIEEEDLITQTAVEAALPGTWREVAKEAKSGIVLPCQTTRFADPDGVSSGLSRFRSVGAKGDPEHRVDETAELSSNGKGAKTAYATMLGWFAGCTDARVQLLSTYRVDRVGDQAMLMVLRGWQRPQTTILAGVARTGRATTTTVVRYAGPSGPAPRTGARLLAEAVNGLCSLPTSGACAELPVLREAAPVPSGQVPAMLGTVDLPPIARVERPWVGTEPEPVGENLAASRCDNTDFDVPGMRRAMTRSFVIPGADLSDLFGLTETVGRLPEPRAKEFVAEVRTKLRTCSDRDLGTDVVRVAEESTTDHDLTVWHVRTEISDQETITYLMGIVREGRAVAQVGFVPDGRAQMAPGAFIELVQRAAERLPAR